MSETLYALGGTSNTQLRSDSKSVLAQLYPGPTYATLGLNSSAWGLHTVLPSALEGPF